MSETAAAILLLAAILWMIRELTVALVTRRRTRAMLNRLRVEQTRARFAECRNELLALVDSGELQPLSDTFRVFYWITTAVMRRPDEYAGLSRDFRNVIANQVETDPHHELSIEARTWSPRVVDMILEFSNALGKLIIDYSRSFTRFISTVAMRYFHYSPLDLVSGPDDEDDRPGVIYRVWTIGAVSRSVREDIGAVRNEIIGLTSSANGRGEMSYA